MNTRNRTNRMNRMNRTSLTMCVSALILCAGTAVPAALAQSGANDRPNQQKQHQTYDNQRSNTNANNDRRVTPLKFRSMGELDGATVTNAAGDEVGTVSDVIIERGRNDISYLIVKSGAWLGMGGREVAVPYSAFGWDNQNNHPTLDMTKDQLRARPEFSEDRWDGNNDAANMSDPLHKELDAAWGTDPYAERLSNAKVANINGKVTSVERRTSPHSTAGRSPNRGEPNREDIILVVRTDDGNTERVVLGPSWYVLGSEDAPMRGDQVTISAFEVPGAGSTEYIARSVDTNGRSLNLRDDKGMCRWGAKDSDSIRSTGTHARYVLFSDLDGKSVECHGKSCGSVDDAVVEIGSGRVAFLSIDPDENFLGIADQDRLIPLNVVSMTTDEKINLDATKDMVLSSRETPDDITTLSQSDVNAIYRAFDVRAPEFTDIHARSEELTSSR